MPKISVSKLNTETKFLDVESLTHTLRQLKIDYNKLLEEKTKYKTKNTQLESFVHSLNADLKAQRIEIQKIYDGRSPRPNLLQ